MIKGPATVLHHVIVIIMITIICVYYTRFYTHVFTQWAAVSTCSESIRVPPHTYTLSCGSFLRMATCHGYSPAGVRENPVEYINMLYIVGIIRAIYVSTVFTA